MKPFDLEAAKRGEPIQTRDGKPAKFIAHVPEANESQRIIVMVDRDIWTTHENGKGVAGWELTSDLCMAPSKRTVYVNVWKLDSGGLTAGNVHLTERAARDAFHSHASACAVVIAHPIEIEE